jgi:RNA-directed DNA polymerase
MNLHILVTKALDGKIRAGGGGGRIHETYSNIISLKNLFTAWKEFVVGKKNKKDVLEFTVNYERELIALQTELASGTYTHGGYYAFTVCDPKRRSIHKAGVRDRVLHHAIHRILVPVFEPAFIFDSYSSRKGKGVHAARERFHEFARKLSRNNTKTVWVLKCDIRKFFDSVDQGILMGLLAKRVSDPKTLQLLENVIRSYGSGTTAGGGIPLGNLTSQLFSNVYMDPFDQFMKRILRVKCYIRYADDFVVLSRERKYLEDLVPTIKKFFAEELGLEVHPNKIELKKWHQGVDFLGAIMFPHFRVLRTKTKKRAMRKIGKSMASYKRGVTEYENTASIIRSYLGIMDHVNSFGLKRDVLVLVRNGSTALENVEKH